jgi:hypothetical protein
MQTFGIELTIQNPAAEARAELAQLKAALTGIESALAGNTPRLAQGTANKPGLWQRVKAAIAPARPSTGSGRALAAGSGRVISEQARRVLAEGDPLFLDYETTGLYASQGARVVEVSVINSQGRVVFSTLVNPQRPIPAEASAVHGIFNADVDGAPTWDDIAPALRFVLEHKTVVAFPARFERKFTPQDWAINWVCAKQLTDAALDNGQGHPAGAGSLAARLRQLGLELAEEHTAAGDSLSTLRLMRRLAGISGNVELVY